MEFDKILQFMHEALLMAKLAIQNKEVPVGCVFVDNDTNEIIAKAHNLTNISKNATLHCEIICLSKLPKGDYTLFVTCEPCIMCAEALNIYGIKQVYFGCYNTKFGGNGTVLKINEYESTGGYLQEECTQLLQEFYADGNENLEEQFRHRKKVKQ